jgi:hypothetical protein
MHSQQRENVWHVDWTWSPALLQRNSYKLDNDSWNMTEEIEDKKYYLQKAELVWLIDSIPQTQW